MANRKPQRGDRCRLVAEVTRVWPDGKVSVHVRDYDYPITVPENTLEDVEPKPKPVKPQRQRKHSDEEPIWDEP